MAEPTASAWRARSPHSESTSLTLLEKIRNNKPEAWERLAYLYGPLIGYWCRRCQVPLEAHDDIRQEVFIVVFQKREEFRKTQPQDTFRGWLRGISNNVIHRWWRDNQSEAQAEGGSDAAVRLGEVPAPALVDEDSESERTDLVRRAIRLVMGLLSPQDQQIVQLFFNERLTYREIAARLDLRPGTVRVRVCRLKKRVLDELGEDWTDLP